MDLSPVEAPTDVAVVEGPDQALRDAVPLEPQEVRVERRRLEPVAPQLAPDNDARALHAEEVLRAHPALAQPALLLEAALRVGEVGAARAGPIHRDVVEHGVLELDERLPRVTPHADA